MNAAPYSSGCGVEIADIDLGNLSSEQAVALQQALFEHGVLFVRGQDLSPEGHLRLAGQIGSIVLNKFFQHLPEYSDIAEVRKEKEQRANIGGGWHADHSYDEIPALGSILVARELPESGGDTLFANMYAAYDGLSPGMQQMLEGLRAVHSSEHLYGPAGVYQKTDLSPLLQGKDLVSNAVHPAVIRHPETGRKALYVNPGHCVQFEGWRRSESQPLLRQLYEHATQPQFTCRFRWQPGDVAIWDNRCSWHYAINDYHGQKRLMHRITIAGSALS